MTIPNKKILKEEMRKAKRESRYPLRIRFKPLQIYTNWDRERKSIANTGIFYGINYVEPKNKKVMMGILDISEDCLSL